MAHFGQMQRIHVGAAWPYRGYIGGKETLDQSVGLLWSGPVRNADGSRETRLPEYRWRWNAFGYLWSNGKHKVVWISGYRVMHDRTRQDRTGHGWTGQGKAEQSRASQQLV